MLKSLNPNASNFLQQYMQQAQVQLWRHQLWRHHTAIIMFSYKFLFRNKILNFAAHK